MKLRLISLMVAAAFAAAGPALAANTDSAREAELKAAREALREAAERVAELSRDQHKVRLVEVDRIRSRGDRARLGIVMSSDDDGAGVRIAAVTPNGPAAKAGLRSGDRLQAIDGKALSARGQAGVDQVRELLGGLKQDQKVRLRYLRDGKAGETTVTAGDAAGVMVFPGDDGFTFEFRRDLDDMVELHELKELADIRSLPLIHPGIEMELARVAAAGCAASEDCPMPVLAKAFRFTGLNLAPVDDKLGRYFGTDHGVLVLSEGPGLAPLEPGDVIQRIEGKAVATPRDAMRALRDQEAGEKLQVQVLRDRKARTLELTVPEAPSFKWFAPPPPAPPAPPAPPPAPPAPPAAPAPPPPPTDQAAVVFADGVVTRIATRDQRVD